MRILHISTRLILGGSQENTVLSCEGQAAGGHEVHLAFGPIYGPEGSFLPRVEAWNAHPDNADRTIRAHVVPDLVRPIDPRRDLTGLKQLKNLIRAIRPDIVHTHSSKAGILGRAAAWAVMQRDRTPMGIVHTIHGPPFHAYERALKNRVYIASERWAAKRCHLIVGVCEAMAAQFKDAKIGRGDQYRVVYSGMEVEKYLDARDDRGHAITRETVRDQLGLGGADFVVGTVARLAELKGHDDILDALGEEMRRDGRLKLLWVGDGWWGDRLRGRVAAMGLSSQVVTPGLVPNERIPAMMRAMDVLVHASYREGLPRTVPQALLSGTAVVATDVDGTREACNDGETGRLVPVGVASAIREAVIDLRANPGDREKLTNAGRALCRARFDARTMVDELENVYVEALAIAKERGR